MEKSYLKCTVINGKYKGKQLTIEIGQTGTTSNVKIDNKTLECVQEAIITIRAGELTTVDLILIGDALE